MKKFCAWIIVVLMLNLLSGCGNSSIEAEDLLLGRWYKNDDRDNGLVFNADGTMIYVVDGVDYTYDSALWVVEEDKITFIVNGEEEKFEYIIDDDHCILKGNDASRVKYCRCSGEELLWGRWRAEDDESYAVAFNPDGTVDLIAGYVVYDYNGLIRWVTEGNRITFKEGGESNSGVYELQGDRLTIRGDDSARTYRRECGHYK